MRKLAFLLILPLLAACANGPQPRNTVAALEEALAAADRLAIEYVTLPDCDLPTAKKPFCSETKAVQDIEQYKNLAKIAVTRAEAAVLDPNASGPSMDQAILAATQALGAFRDAVPFIVEQ